MMGRTTGSAGGGGGGAFSTAGAWATGLGAGGAFVTCFLGQQQPKDNAKTITNGTIKLLNIILISCHLLSLKVYASERNAQNWSGGDHSGL
jgi:hypothetical protein